jgi:hypothetical protein
VQDETRRDAGVRGREARIRAKARIRARARARMRDEGVRVLKMDHH